MYRYNPDLIDTEKATFQLDCPMPKIPLEEYAYNEDRFQILKKKDPELAAVLMNESQEEVDRRWDLYKQMTMQ